ncbi:methyl-accepting chemotaxis protein, partial [Variovorax sp. J22P271]|nr:methyl-accepting chemotaxis protein [Variovorax sp. J22P271]
TSGIEQINQAITQMDQVTQQNAALVEEAAAAAGSLQEQASSLVKAVGVFKLDAATAGRSEPAFGRPAAVAPMAVRRTSAPTIEKKGASAPQLASVASAAGDWTEF